MFGTARFDLTTGVCVLTAPPPALPPPAYPPLTESAEFQTMLIQTSLYVGWGWFLWARPQSGALSVGVSARNFVGTLSGTGST